MIKRRLAGLALVVLAVLGVAALFMFRRSRPELEMTRIELSGSSGDVEDAAFSPDSKTLACAGMQGILLWDAETGDLLKTLDGHICGSLAYSPDGKTLAAAAGIDRDDRALILIDLKTDAVKTLEKLDDTVLTAAYSPNGKTVASVGKNLTSKKHTIRVWDAETGAHLQELTTIESELTNLVYSPDGKTLIVFYCAPHTAAKAHDEYQLALWNVDGGYKKFEPPAFTYQWAGSSKTAAYSPDGQRLAVSARNFILLFDAYTAEFVQVLEHCEWGPDVRGLAYSPDSKLLASGDDGSKHINIWNAYTGENLKRLPIHRIIWHLAFSPDGKKLAGVGSFEVFLWKIDPVSE